MAADYEPFATKIEKVIDSYNFMRGQVLFSMKQQLIEADAEAQEEAARADAEAQEEAARAETEAQEEAARAKAEAQEEAARAEAEAAEAEAQEEIENQIIAFEAGQYLVGED